MDEKTNKRFDCQEKDEKERLREKEKERERCLREEGCSVRGGERQKKKKKVRK